MLGMVKKLNRKNHQQNINKMITVFYDDKCNLCSREINYYRAISPIGAFNWQKISKSTEQLNQEGIPSSKALMFLHVKDCNNQIHIGVDAFIIIWQQFKYWKVLAAFVALPIIKQAVNFIYVKFAQWRFKRLSYCATDN